MAQLMPLPLTVSQFSKIPIGFTFLVPAYPCSPGKRAVKRVCVCVILMAVWACLQTTHIAAAVTHIGHLASWQVYQFISKTETLTADFLKTNCN